MGFRVHYVAVRMPGMKITAGLDGCVVGVSHVLATTGNLPTLIHPCPPQTEVTKGMQARGEAWVAGRERKNFEKRLNVFDEGMWMLWVTTVACADEQTRKWVRLIQIRYYPRPCVIAEVGLH